MLEWPFVHRGITHTLLVGSLATGLVAYRYRRAGLTVGVTYASHLLIDVTTPKGIPHLYPFVEQNFHLDLWTTGHSPGPTALTWICCLGMLWLIHTGRLDAPRF
ncbi:MAG: metal-dependent hydrolase, partial [Halapricum sp.]